MSRCDMPPAFSGRAPYPTDLSFFTPRFALNLVCLTAMNQSEWQTRKGRIDTRLRSCNPAWQLVPWRTGLPAAKLMEAPRNHGSA